MMNNETKVHYASPGLYENNARMKSLGGPPPLGLHLVLGPTFKEIIAVTRQNLAEGRLAPTVIYTRKN